MTLVRRLIFVDRASQVSWLKKSFTRDSDTAVVAVTASAAQALEEEGLSHVAVCAYADMRKVVSTEFQFVRWTFELAQEIEDFIADRYPPAKFEGPGFLSGQAYWIQTYLSAILTRAFAMREAIRALSPVSVTVLQSEISPFFVHEGYARDAWLDIVEEMAHQDKFEFEVLACSSSEQGSVTSTPSRFRRLLKKTVMHPRQAYRTGLKKIVLAARFFGAGRISNQLAREIEGLRLLMVDGTGYDWRPALESLRFFRNASVMTIDGVIPYPEHHMWLYHYEPVVHRSWSRQRNELDAGTPYAGEPEVEAISSLFDQWLTERPRKPEFRLLGINFFPVLVPHLRTVATKSAALARHADKVATLSLDMAKPHAVCFNTVGWMATQRFAYICRQRGIPTLTYQHGGTLDKVIPPKNDQLDRAHADYVLTYGVGIQPPARPAFPVRSESIPVGSARLEVMRARASSIKPGRGRRLKILWVGEISTGNTFGGTFQFEDTARYLFQKKYLTMLANSGKFSIAYRPYPGQVQWDGTSSWIKRTASPFLSVDSEASFDDLLVESDLVLTDNTSGTIWDECIAANKPMILYLDPAQTPLNVGFDSDLDRACYWCRSEEGFEAAIRRLANDPESMMKEIMQKDTSVYLCKYVFHREDGRCVERVLTFLNSVCRNGRPIKRFLVALHSQSVTDVT